MKYIFIIILFLLTNCGKKTERIIIDFSELKEYEIILSNLDYDINLRSGALTAEYAQIKDTVKFSNEEKKQIAKLFFENYIDTINYKTSVYNNDGITITPDLGTSIKIKTKKKDIEIYISGHSDSTKVTKKGKDLMRFENGVYKLLKQNKKMKMIKSKIDFLPKMMYL